MPLKSDFISRLHNAFDDASMADVARRLGIPHATVRNYYQGRLPAPEVLIKIGRETGVSLNWLLDGQGDKYAGQVAPIGLGRFFEEKIAEIIDRKLSDAGDRATRAAAKKIQAAGVPIFDLRESVVRLDDPQAVMSEWFKFEERKYPKDYGIVFFRGWESFSPEEKIAALGDAKSVLDRSLKSEAV